VFFLMLDFNGAELRILFLSGPAQPTVSNPMMPTIIKMIPIMPAGFIGLQSPPRDEVDDQNHDRDYEQDVNESAIVYELTKPSSQSTSRMTNIVQSIMVS